MNTENNKLPSVNECLQKAIELSVEYQDAETIDNFEFEPEYIILQSRLIEFIKYCQNEITAKSKIISTSLTVEQ